MHVQRDQKRARIEHFDEGDGNMILDDYFESSDANVMVNALSKGDLETAKRLWPKVPASARGTLFHGAALRFYTPNILEWMLNQPDFDVNYRNHYGHTVLDVAYIACRPKIVAKIESMGGRSGTQEVEWYMAIVRGDMDTIKRIVAKEGMWLTNLWKSGRDVDLPVHWAAQSGQLEVLQYLIENDLCPYPTDTDDAEVPSALYATGVNQDTPLLRAAERGHLPIVEWIIQKNGGKMGRLSWRAQGPSPWIIKDRDCLRLLMQCPDFDAHADCPRLKSGSTYIFKGWDLGDAACQLIARSIPYQRSKNPTVIDISDNPRIGARGLKTLETHLSEFSDYAIQCRFTRTVLKVTCSHIPPGWISRLHEATSCACVAIINSKHDNGVEFDCSFPSLYTIALWNLVDLKNRANPTEPPEIEWKKHLPATVYQDFQNILDPT